MSRLNSAIRRLQAQCACLNAAVDTIGDIEGLVLELGLGNGRTYDHLREALPDRRICVFERQVAPHPDCTPPDADLFVGEMEETLAAFARAYPAGVVLAHADIGSGDRRETERNAIRIAPLLVPILRKDGLLVSDQPFVRPEFMPIELPADVTAGRYYMYRRV